MTSDGAVSWGYFGRALKSMNPKVVLDPPRNPNQLGAMVYLRLPRHPESDPVTGLWEVLAVPAPRYFRQMPKHDVEHGGKWVRGWGTFFKSVRKMRDPFGRVIFDPKRVKALFPGVYDRFNSRQFKQDLNERNEAPEAKINRKLRKSFKQYLKSGA